MNYPRYHLVPPSYTPSTTGHRTGFYCILTPSGALYVNFCYQRPKPTLPFSLSPIPLCHNMHPRLLQNNQCNSGQLTQLMQKQTIIICLCERTHLPRRPYVEGQLIQSLSCIIFLTLLGYPEINRQGTVLVSITDITLNCKHILPFLLLLINSCKTFTLFAFPQSLVSCQSSAKAPSNSFSHFIPKNNLYYIYYPRIMFSSSKGRIHTN